MNPNLADAYFQLGEYLALKGDLSEYVSQLKTAHELDPLSPMIVRRFGYALLYAGRGDEARDHWYKTLHLDPFNAYRGLTDYFMIKGEYDQAAKMVGELEKLQPLSSFTLLNMGFLAALRGDRERAESVIRTMKQNYPSGSVASAFAGLIYFALGDLDKFFVQMQESSANNTLPALNPNAISAFCRGKKGSSNASPFFQIRHNDTVSDRKARLRIVIVWDYRLPVPSSDQFDWRLVLALIRCEYPEARIYLVTKPNAVPDLIICESMCFRQY